ncbi:MAG: hypothetical protein ACPL7J_01025 [Desulfomonilaceae bacterium]
MERSWKAGSSACVDNGQLAATKSATSIAKYPGDKIEARARLQRVIVGPVVVGAARSSPRFSFEGAFALRTWLPGMMRTGRFLKLFAAPHISGARLGRSTHVAAGGSLSLLATKCTIRKRDCQ